MSIDIKRFEEEFEKARESALQTSINILSLRLALVDKGIVTKEELEYYDKTAEQTMYILMLQERDKIKKAIREQFGDEIAKEVDEELEEILSKKIS